MRLEFESSAGEQLLEILAALIVDGLARQLVRDRVKAAAAKVAKLQAAKVSQQAVVAGLDAQLAMMAGWESGSPLQVARFVEVMEQKAAVLADVAAIDAEIVRLTP